MANWDVQNCHLKQDEIPLSAPCFWFTISLKSEFLISWICVSMASNGVLLELFPSQDVKLPGDGRWTRASGQRLPWCPRMVSKLKCPPSVSNRFPNGARASEGQRLNRLNHSYTTLLLEGAVETFKSESNKS